MGRMYRVLDAGGEGQVQCVKVSVTRSSYEVYIYCFNTQNREHSVDFCENFLSSKIQTFSTPEW